MELTPKRLREISYELSKLEVCGEVGRVAREEGIKPECVRFTRRQLMTKPVCIDGLDIDVLGISRDEYATFKRKAAADAGYSDLYSDE
ncbi:MAG: hypothetical protein IPJ68_05395 [Candidatus Moraniibacteriota bacterium]|nr:MAG: hypothetical protein IPJ68_05395 [Candidatus Moranbacteria bacterium]